MFTSNMRLTLTGVCAFGLALVAAQPAIGQPVNDDCANAMVVNAGTTPFSTVGATTDGPPTCLDLSDDVWFSYFNRHGGSLKISTCTPALTFESVFTIYRGIPACPRMGPNDCNNVGVVDPECDSEGSSIRVSIGGYTMNTIRVGGHDGQQGDGELVITPCVGDFNLSGTVDILDLSILLSNFGDSTPFSFQGDIEGDGDVDITDLAILLEAFGTRCE